MGNHNSDLTQAEFKSQWKQVHQIDGLTVWENKKYPNQKVDQYIVRDEQLENNQKLYQLRKDSTFLVKAYSLKKEGFSCQMDHDAKKLFVQRTPLRLSNLKDIPYPDIFHLYDVCIHGYQQLSKVVGYFSIDEDQVGINEKGQAKVWLSNRFESNKINGVNVTESKMVGDILNMLYQVADNDSCGKYHNIYWYIGNHEKITFAEAYNKFVEYVRTYCDGEVPTRLSCVSQVGPSNIEDWCRTNQSFGYTTDNTRLSEQLYQNTAGRGAKAPEASYRNVVNQPLSSQNNLQTFTTNYNGIAPTIETKVSEPNLKLATHPGPQINGNVPQTSIVTNCVSSYPFSQVPVNINTQIGNSVAKPLRTQKLVNGQLQTNGSINFSGRPSTSSNLVQTTYGAQNLNKFIQRPITINSQAQFVTNNNPVLPSPSPQVVNQPPPQVIQRCLPPQNVTLLQQGHVSLRPQGPGLANTQIPFTTQVQPVVFTNQHTIVPQTSTTSYNPHYQIVQQTAQNMPRDDTRLHQQRVISQTIELKNAVKPVEAQNTSITYTQTNGYKAHETNGWESNANKQQTNTNENTNGLSNYGRAVPYSFDVTTDKRTEILNDNKFTPEHDGKSSPEFLALLSQIKSGTGQKDTFSQNFSSYSPSKMEGNYTTYQESNFVSGDYVSNKYASALDPELHADLQKFKQ